MVVSLGICARCKKQRNCRFRQPGTWVVECEVFEQDPKHLLIDVLSQREQPPGTPSEAEAMHDVC